MLRTMLRGILCTGLLAAPALAQVAVQPASALPDGPSLADALDVGDFTLQQLTIPAPADQLLQVPVVIDGQSVTMVLEPTSVRSPDKFQVLVQGADGALTEVEPAPPTTWRGELAEVPGSAVAGSLANGRFDAVVRLGESLPVWGVQPARDIDPDLGADEFFVYSSADLLHRDYSCGGNLMTGDVERLLHPGPQDGYQGTSNQQICEIACDADVEFYNQNGSSVANTQADIENIINRVEIIYDAQTAILYEITTILVRTSEPDPYGSTNPGTLLNQFSNEWNSNQGSIQRDVAHLFTGKNINGSVIGIAQLNVICNKFSAYGLSQSKFTGNLVFRTALTAHEVGHNWSAQHCDGQGDCAIMCSGIGGCSGGLTSFGNSAVNSILNKKNSVGCLEDAVPPPPPTITNVSPSSTSVLGGANITLTGTDFDKAIEVDVGGQVLGEGTFGGFTILDASTITFSAPTSTVLGSVGITVTNTGGTSSPASLDYVEQVPPVYTAPTLAIVLVDPNVHITYATVTSQSCFWIFSLSNTTANYKGFPLLVVSPFILPVPLSPAGTGAFDIPLDMSLSGMGLNFATQMAFFQGSALQTISTPILTNIF